MINLIYPALCQACGVKTEAWNEIICGDCLKKLRRRLPPFCLKCGRQVPPAPEPGDTCPDCKKGGVYFDRALSAFHYDGVLKELVRNFKYNKVTCMAGKFSELTLSFMREHGMGRDSDIVVPIPMHPVRLFMKEINHSNLLAKNIARRLDVRYSDAVLKKINYTKPQVKLKRNERIKNIKGSFSLTKRGVSSVRHKNILLVDDLFTTGSTVNECSRVLKKAGAGRVDVITLARGDISQ